MLGEEYLETRKRLASITGQVRTLALRIDAPADELEKDSVREGLKSPIRILVCGEKESGKTAFLSSLVGKNLVVTDPKAIQVFGPSILSPEQEDEVLGYHRILEVGELELIDTRGISELSEQGLERIKALMPTCDYVLWIVSSGNPWASTTWDLISESRELVGKRQAVVLQQIDLRPADDVPILLDHLRSLSIQRVGHALPIHCVSATIAAASWSNTYRDTKRWKISGYKSVESILDKQISTSQEREQALRHAFDSTKIVIDRLEESILRRAHALKGDKHVLQAVEAEVERARETEVRNARENLNKLGSVVTEQVEHTVKYASKKNGVIGTLISLFTRGDGAVAVEKRLQESVSESASVRAREIAFSMLSQCEKHWNIMRPELQRKMAVNVVDFDTHGFEKKVNEFSTKMENSTRHAMVLLKLRRLLDRMMVARQHVLKRVLILVLALVSAAGVTGYLSDELQNKLPFLMLGIAGVLVLWMVWYGKRTKDALIYDYADTIVDARLHLAEMIEDDYVDEVRDFFTAYFPMFENIRRYIVEAESDLEPKQKEWHELFLMLKAIEQEL
ncbi:MAG: GTPase SAR1 family protein [Cryomorphaceae bacterium]|jgi:GTPase SAR1 family protein